jgi:thiosulfate/3-mercaptopyruvate sulfurtransferase
MNLPRIPLILDADDVVPLLDTDGVVIVDLSDDVTYESGHLPGAIRIETARLSASRPPVMGLLPPETEIGALLSEAGIRPDVHVIAYDGENNIKACRFLWTLDVIGHRGFSLLNGGLNAWLDAGLELDDKLPNRTPSEYPVSYRPDHIAEKRYILDHLQDPDIVVLDTRTELEYNGVDKRAQRAGHIPGARNLDWSHTVIGGGDFRFRPVDEVRALYAHEGITSDKEVIVHCQTHMRSSHSYILLKALGFERVKGYPGSWSDWGNDPETPIEH